MLLEAGHDIIRFVSWWAVSDQRCGDVFAYPAHRASQQFVQGEHDTSLVADPRTEVGSNLEINLVGTPRSPSASGFKTAIIDAAQYFVDTYINPLSGGGKDIVNIKVGYGEIAGRQCHISAGRSETMAT